ncbi:hypothetical protein JXA40_02765 [bacterium]|nr:hypothetical protein [candidate division CSSED10-310 bacterium]
MHTVTRIITSILVCTGAIHAADTPYYISADHAILRTSPGGPGTATIRENTEIRVMEIQGDWVRISLTGWVQKLVLTASPPSEKSGKTTGELPAGNGFYYRNVRMTDEIIGTRIAGEILNRGDQSGQLVKFLVQLYGKDGTLLFSDHMNLADLPVGSTVPFETLVGTPMTEIDHYLIQYNGGY